MINCSLSLSLAPKARTFSRGEGGRAKRGRMWNGEMLDTGIGLLQCNNHENSARIPPQSASLTAPPREELWALPRHSNHLTVRYTEI